MRYHTVCLRAALTACAAIMAVSPFAHCQPPTTADQTTPAPAYNLRVESFAPTRAYAVGTDTMTFTATVRNAATTPVEANTVRARFVCLAGLDYVEGDTAPWIPALEPNGSVSYKWRVQPTSSESALVTSFVLDAPNSKPIVNLLPVQHYSESPRTANPPIPKAPMAQTASDGGVIANERMMAYVRLTNSNVPALFISARVGPGWRSVGVELPIAQVLSGEGGQDPWWEVFRCDDVNAVTANDRAILTLSGGFGLRWRATVTLTLTKGATVLETSAKLSPLKTVKIAGFRFGPYLAGDGSFGSVVDQVIGPKVGADATVLAVKSQNITTGLACANTPLLPNWITQPVAAPDGVDYRVMGFEARSNATAVELTPGALVEARSGIRALGPTPPPPPKPKVRAKRHHHRRHVDDDDE